MARSRRALSHAVSRSLLTGVAVLVIGACASACGSSSSSSTAASSSSGSGSGSSSSDSSSSGGGPVKIGATFSLSGPLAAVGAPYEVAFNAAIKYINGHGGVLGGRKLEGIVLDDKGDATQAAATARELTSDGVSAIVADPSSPAFLPQAPIFDGAKIPVVTGNTAPSSSDPKQDPYVFTIYGTPEDSGNAVADYAIKTRGLKKVAIIYENSAYGNNEYAATKPAITAAGGTVVSSQSFQTGATSVVSQMNQLKASGANVLVMWTYGAGAVSVMQAETAANWHPVTVGPYYIGSNPGFRSAVGSSGLKNVFGADGGAPLSMLYSGSQTPSARSAPYRESLAGFTGDPIGGIIIFDGVEIVAQAIDKAGSTSPAAVKAAIESGTPFKGIRQDYTFSPTVHHSFDISSSGAFGGSGTCDVQKGCEAAPGVSLSGS